MIISASTQSCIIHFYSFFHRLFFINNKIMGLAQNCPFLSNSSQQKLSRPPRESFKEIVEEILGGNLECGSAQPSLFLYFYVLYMFIHIIEANNRKMPYVKFRLTMLNIWNQIKRNLWNVQMNFVWMKVLNLNHRFLI